MEYYNWDSLIVGAPNLNHSENFFCTKHKAHEKDLSRHEKMSAESSMDMDNEQQQIANFDIIEKSQNRHKITVNTIDKENISSLNNQKNSKKPKTEKRQVLATKTTSTKALLPRPVIQKPFVPSKAVPQDTVNKKPLKTPSLHRVIEIKPKVIPQKTSTKPNAQPKALVIKDVAKRISSQKPSKPVSRITTQKPISRNTVSSHPLKSSKLIMPSLETKFIQKPINRKTFNEVTTRMTNYAHVYAQRKENLLQKLSENEKNHRVFRCNPVPKSRPTGAITPKPKAVVKNAPHQTRPAVKQVKVESNINVYPKFPTNQPKPRITVHVEHSQQKKTEKTGASSHQFVATKPKVLQIAPFKPKLHQKPHLIKMEPFNLKVTDRVSKRKEFDDIVKREQAEKKKQKDEFTQRMLEESSKLLRKQTEFRAKPNPFKKPAIAV